MRSRKFVLPQAVSSQLPPRLLGGGQSEGHGNPRHLGGDSAESQPREGERPSEPHWPKSRGVKQFHLKRGQTQAVKTKPGLAEDAGGRMELARMYKRSTSGIQAEQEWNTSEA
jgi:hypothetical protein